jgi:ribulose kinase
LVTHSSHEKYVIGVDYGTLSGRAAVVRVSDGAELGTGVCDYPRAVMDSELDPTGAKLPPEWALQVPSDYVNNQVPRAYFDDASAAGRSIHEHLTALGKDQPVGVHGLVALDWYGGNHSALLSMPRSRPASMRALERRRMQWAS